MSEEFVHDTRCANISQALSAGIGQLSLQWLSWTSRHQSHVGAQTVISHEGLTLGLGSRHWYGKCRKGIMGN